MGILEGKRILVTGVLTDSSIAFHVARLCQEQGATVVLTGYGRLTLVERIAKRLPEPPPVLELDVTNDEHLDTLADRVAEHVDGLDGIVHSIGYTPQEALGGNFLNTRWEHVATALHTSTFSLKSLTTALLPLMKNGGSVVALDFDNSVSYPSTTGWAWPRPDWPPPPATLPATSVSRRSGSTCLGRAAEHHGSPQHPRLRGAGRGMAEARPAGLGHHRPGPRPRGRGLLSDWFSPQPGRSCTSTEDPTPPAHDPVNGRLPGSRVPEPT